MKQLFILVSAIVVLPLSACNKTPSDKLADRVENAADARADAMEDQANMLDTQAKQIRETGEQRSDAIEAANGNVAAMTQDQRDAIVANKSPAVR